MVNGMGINTGKNGNSALQRCCATLELKISPERIHFLKFILEGYDGLAILSTVNAGQGIVRILYPPEIESDLNELLRTIEPQIRKNPKRI